MSSKMPNSSKKSSNLQAYFTVGVMIVEFIIAILIYQKFLGSPDNFEGGDPEKGHPLNMFGTMYKGGFIVPLLIAIVLIVFTFAVERLITLLRARGTGNISNFVRNIRELVEAERIDEAMAACDRQKGSIGNVVRAGLEKYRLVANDPQLDKEQKLAAIQKDLEEATSLELPMLSKNLVILSTCASIATLIGLIGTVLGMIRAFSALANAGAPDSNALATGISEALVNTFIGIAGSCFAIVFFNIFTTQIDRITYGIDEANFSILQTFSAKKH
jgi:biopolymer transport protein ExbB